MGARFQPRSDFSVSCFSRSSARNGKVCRRVRLTQPRLPANPLHDGKLSSLGRAHQRASIPRAALRAEPLEGAKVSFARRARARDRTPLARPPEPDARRPQELEHAEVAGGGRRVRCLPRPRAPRASRPGRAEHAKRRHTARSSRGLARGRRPGARRVGRAKPSQDVDAAVPRGFSTHSAAPQAPVCAQPLKRCEMTTGRCALARMRSPSARAVAGVRVPEPLYDCEVASRARGCKDRRPCSHDTGHCVQAHEDVEMSSFCDLCDRSRSKCSRGLGDREVLREKRSFVAIKCCPHGFCARALLHSPGSVASPTTSSATTSADTTSAATTSAGISTALAVPSFHGRSTRTRIARAEISKRPPWEAAVERHGAAGSRPVAAATPSAQNGPRVVRALQQHRKLGDERP